MFLIQNMKVDLLTEAGHAMVSDPEKQRLTSNDIWVLSMMPKKNP